jgi:hypothetical protein
MEVTLSREEALVLFEFLSRFSDQETLAIEDQAEARVLWDILAALESELDEPFQPDYANKLSEARSNIRDTES